MTTNQNLALAADMIRVNTPNLRLLIQLLEDGGQKKLAMALSKPAKPATPSIPINGRPHPDPVLWLRGRVE
jgi:hypothetical protein